MPAKAGLKLGLTAPSSHPLRDELVKGVLIAAALGAGDLLLEHADFDLELVALAQDQALLQRGVRVVDLEVGVAEHSVVKHAVLAGIDQVEQLAFARHRVALERGSKHSLDDRTQPLVGHSIQDPFALCHPSELGAVDQQRRDARLTAGERLQAHGRGVWHAR